MSDSIKNPRPGNEVIREQTIVLDADHLVKKSFINCRLVFAGGLPPVLQDCDFIDSNFALDGAALNTASFLASLAHAGDSPKAVVFAILGISIDG